MTKRMVALCIAALVVAALAPTAANADTFTTSTTIRINTLGNGFSGVVSSPKGACVSNRHVTLQRKKQGQTSFSNVGTDNTASNGAWDVTSAPIDKAQYRAVVASKDLAGTNKCRAAVSATTTAHKSAVTIQQGGSNFHGVVNSVPACEPNRRVSLQRKTIYQSSFSTIGSDMTNSTGFWVVGTNPISGASYRSTVSAKQNGPNSCMRDTSPVIVAS